MARKRYTPEEIIQHLRTVELEQGKGLKLEQAAKKVGVTPQTIVRWRNEYGGMKVDQAKRLKELEKENARLKRVVADMALDNAILKDVAFGKLLSPIKRREAVTHAIDNHGVSERRACKVIGQARTTQRYQPKNNEEKEKLRGRIIELAEEYGRYGYRTITDMLNNEGWRIGKDAVYTIWREEGLQVPQKQPKRGRLWLADGSCIRLRPEHPNHVWSYDFVHDRTHDGKAFRILNIVDEFTKESLATFVKRKINSQDVILVLAELFLLRGIPKHIRSDNGPEFIAKRLVKWLEGLEVGPLFIQPGSPWENGYVESFNGKMRDQFLNGEIFYSLFEAKVLIERWRVHYNTVRPHSSLGGKPPAPKTIQPKLELLAV
ncbi:MAG: IS3 family transposase [Bdellovibrionales bacterium]|nr:IS3 family transposase [Bdellovibrionales bacterium]